MILIRFIAVMSLLFIQPFTSFAALPTWVNSFLSSVQYSAENQQEFNDMLRWLDRHGYLSEDPRDWNDSHPEDIGKSYEELKKRLASLRPTAIQLDYIWRIKHELLPSKKDVSGIGCRFDCGLGCGVGLGVGVDWVEMPGFKSAPCLTFEGRASQGPDYGQGELGVYGSVRTRSYTTVTSTQRPIGDASTDGFEMALGVGGGHIWGGKRGEDKVYNEYCISAGLGGTGGGEIRQIYRSKVFFESKFFNKKWWKYCDARKIERKLASALRRLDWVEVEKLTAEYRGIVNALWTAIVPKTCPAQTELTHGHPFENVHNLYMNKKIWRAHEQTPVMRTGNGVQGNPPEYSEY